MDLKWNNPLTTEERTNISRLLEHDTSGKLNQLQGYFDLVNSVENPSEFTKTIFGGKDPQRILEHIKQTHFALDVLSGDQIGLYSNGKHDHLSSSNLEHFLTTIDHSVNHKVNFRYSPSLFPGRFKFYAPTPVLHSILHNMLKNSNKHGRVDESTVVITKEYAPNKDIVFESSGSRNHSQFYGFHVEDVGRGFPKDKRLEDYFQRPEDLNKGGFGTYFMGLAAKVLQAKVGISSTENATIVSFYHPLLTEGSVMG